MNTTILFIIILVVLAASLGTGIAFLKKYFKTKAKKFLFAGIAFTLVIPGIIIYVAYKVFVRPQVTCYIAGPINQVGNASVAFLLYRKGLIKKLSDRLPKHVSQKISKK